MLHTLQAGIALPRVTLALVLAAGLGACSQQSTTRNRPSEGPSMTAQGAQTFAGLTFTLPAGFTLKDSTEEKVASPIPGAPPTVEHFRSFVNAAGQGLYLFYWDGIPVRDRGPMVVAEKWETTVGGEKATISLTSTFFGKAQRVLAAHFAGPPPARNRYLIYTTLIDKAAFETLLGSARFTGGAAGR